MTDFKYGDPVFLNGKAYWSSISKPNVQFDPCYSLLLEMSEKKLKKFEELGYRIKDSKILIRKRAFSTETKPPLVFDKNGNELGGVPLLGNGSEVSVRAIPCEAKNKFGLFKSLILDAVMIKKLVRIKTKNKFYETGVSK